MENASSTWRKVGLGTSRYAITDVELHLYGPRRARRWWWSSQPLDRESAYLHPGYLLRFYVFLVPPGGARGAGAGRLVQLPYWTRSTPSFAPPGGVRGPGAGAGRLVLLTCWTRSTPSFAPPGGVRGAGAGRLVQLPYWTRPTTPPPILPPTSGMARMWRRGGAQLDEEFAFYASLALSPLTSDLAKRFGGGTLSWTGNLFFHASGSRRRLRAWPGRGDGGVCCLGVEFGFRSFTHWPLDGRPRYAR